MNNAPEWMKRHLGDPGIKPIVSYQNSYVKNTINCEDRMEDILSKRMSQGDMIVLYATPIVMDMQCSKVIGLLREQIIKSRIDEDDDLDQNERKEKRMTDYVKIAQQELDNELIRLKKHGDEALGDYMVALCDKWFSTEAMDLIITWRNAFSAMLLKMKLCNDNENLHEFLCYALAARAIAMEARECEFDIRRVVNKKLEGSGLIFHLHGDSATTKILTATNVICDRFKLPSFDDTMLDLNVRRCKENWMRSVQGVMQIIKLSTTKK